MRAMLCITLISCVKIPSIESISFHSYIHISQYTYARSELSELSFSLNAIGQMISILVFHWLTPSQWSLINARFTSKVNIQIILQIACRQAVSLYMVRQQFIHNVFIFTLLDGDWLRNATFCRKHQIILLKHNMLFFSGQKNRQDGR